MIKRMIKRLNLGFLVLFIVNPLLILSFQNCSVVPSKMAQAQVEAKSPSLPVEPHKLQK